MSGLFTDAKLRALRPRAAPYKRTEGGARGDGRMLVRVRPDGSRDLFYRYRQDGADRLVALGLFDPSGKTGVTLAQARVKARSLTKILHEYGDVKEYLAAQQQHQDEQARRGTLGDLCGAYARHLADGGKVSARAVELALRRNIQNQRQFRRVWDQPAAEITADQIRDILVRLHTEGCREDARRVDREVNKVRSYLHAAFGWGARADHDPRQSAALGKRFALVANPVALVPRIADWDRAGDRTLTDGELATFWKETDLLPPPQRDCLRFLLALGGQRATQVLRAPWSAYDFKTRVLHLLDTKGKGNPRDHLVPLTDLALAQLALARTLNKKAPGPFSSDGERVLVVETLSKAVRGVSDTLLERDKVPVFRLGDLRRTCETTLARLGVSLEGRGWLLSHGRQSNVQARHYDRHTYLPEKLAVLQLWETHLLNIQGQPRQPGRARRKTRVRRQR